MEPPSVVAATVAVVLAAWTIANAIYHSFLVKMENKLMDRFVSDGLCRERMGIAPKPAALYRISGPQ
jgi:hypothetical protein